MLTPDQEQIFCNHLRAIDARETCPICDAGRWTVELREDLIARVCARCGHVLLFDPEPLGLQPGWKMIAPGRYRHCLVPLDSPPMRLADFLRSGQAGP
jgi:hypothetical protein